MQAFSTMTKAKNGGDVVAFAVSADKTKLGVALVKKRETGRLPTRFSKLVRVVVVEPATGTVLHQVNVGEKNLEEFGFAMAISPDGTQLAVGGPCSVRVWEVGKPKAIQHFEGGLRPVASLAFSADGNQLATNHDDNSVLVLTLAR
jgi:WD40 repeat protein